VERRRRETINEGISAISSLLPTHNEKNKGSILSNAAAYISKLISEKDALADKWASEKVVVDESIREFMRRLEHMHQVAEAWKGLAKSAGVDVDGEMERRGGEAGALAIEEVPTREDVEDGVARGMQALGHEQGQALGQEEHAPEPEQAADNPPAHQPASSHKHAPRERRRRVHVVHDVADRRLSPTWPMCRRDARRAARRVPSASKNPATGLPIGAGRPATTRFAATVPRRCAGGSRR